MENVQWKLIHDSETPIDKFNLNNDLGKGEGFDSFIECLNNKFNQILGSK